MKVSKLMILTSLACLTTAIVAHAQESAEQNAAPGAGRRQKLIAKMAEVQGALEGLKIAQGLTRTQACKAAIGPLKEAAQGEYALVLFYPPLHSDAELPALAAFQDLSNDLVHQSSVLGDYCTGSKNSSLNRVPTSQDVKDASQAIGQITGQVQQAVQLDMAPAPKVEKPESSESTPAPAPAPARKLLLHCESTGATPVEAEISTDKDTSVNSIDAQEKLLYTAQVKLGSKTLEIRTGNDTISVSGPAGSELEPVELTVRNGGPTDPSLSISCRVTGVTPKTSE